MRNLSPDEIEMATGNGMAGCIIGGIAGGIITRSPAGVYWGCRFGSYIQDL